MTISRTAWLGTVALGFTFALCVTADAAAIINASHFGIVALQVKPVGAVVWQSDILNQRTLAVGKSLDVHVVGCKVDVLATFDDGHKYMKNNVNLCGGPHQIKDAP